MRRIFRALVTAIAAFSPLSASASGTTYSAVVKFGGELKGGFGAIGSGRISPGVLIVEFAADVSNCAYVASLGNYRSRAPLHPGFVSVASAGGPYVIVRTTTFEGRPHGLAFHLQVGCPKGTTAPRQPSVWAVVNADGSLARGRGVQFTQKTAQGTYEIVFDAFVGRCGITVTRGDAGSAGTSTPGIAMAEPQQRHSNVVGVSTFDASEHASATGFHLQESCRDEAGPAFSAVVGEDGTFVRGIGTSGAQRLAKGQYEVDFPQDVTACSFTAAIGLPGADAPTAPGMINVAGREGNVDAILVQTFNRTSLAADRGFHVIVKC